MATIPNQTTSTGPAGILRNYWKEQLLDILENELMAADLLDEQVIPANSGNVIEFHRINSFAKQIRGVSEWQGYLTPGPKGQSFAVDSIVYGLDLLTNDLEITEKAML
jgi:hypothetical protein